MFAADFVSAASYFRHVIEQSGDLHARRIAKRDLEWWCLPLEAMLKQLQDSPYPVTIEELIRGAGGIRAGKDYARDVAAKLRSMASVVQFSKRLWMHRTHFGRAVDATLGKLEEAELPTRLEKIVGALLTHLACHEAENDPVVLKVVREEVLSKPGMILLDDNCVFRTADLDELRAALVDTIRESAGPARLRTVAGTMPWPRALKQAVRIEGLKRWLYSHEVGKLTEVADGWWFTQGTPDFTQAPLDRVFRQPFEALSTETVLLRYLFQGAQQPHHLLGRCMKKWSECLTHNRSVVRLAVDLWIPAATVREVAGRITAALREATEPEPYEGLVSDSLPREVRSLVLGASLKGCVLSAMRQDPELLELGDELWLHRAALRAALNLAYETLGDGVPRSSAELLSPAFGASEAPATRCPTLAAAFERALQQDGRFIFEADKNVWTPVPPGNANNNSAYVVLYQAWSPLSRLEIVRRAKSLPYRSKSAFDLDSDRRFKRSDDGRWMLAPWILINELAAQYLMSAPLLLDAVAIIARVCELHHLDPANAIFLPKQDPRFHPTSLGKWYCDVPDKTADADVLGRLVRVANEATEGITLEGLVLAALNDDPKNYRNLEKIVLDDGRLLLYEGLWYSKALWFYNLTDQDMAGIEAHLTQIAYPATAEDLAQTCLQRRLGLTDLEERLRQDPLFVAFGTAGWTLTGLQPPSAGLPRDINYPIRSGKYLPELSDQLEDEAEEVSAAERKPGEPAETTAPGQVHGPVRFVTIPLGFEDIRDGSLVVKSHLKQLFGPALNRPAVRFTGEGGTGFSCWYDATNKLLFGFANWFGAQAFTFGDKMTVADSDQQGVFTVRATGRRNEAVYQAGLRHQQVHSLIEDAKEANRSYHDLALEVLEHFGSPLHIDDLWQIVNYRRIARKNTLSAILSSHSYFVSDGAGHWRFHREEYTRMMLELERRVRTLEKENQRLRDTTAEPSGKLEEANLEAVKAREDAAALQAENEQLQADKGVLAAQAAEIPALTAQLDQLDAGLEDARVALRQQEATNAELRDGMSAASEQCKEVQDTLASAEVASRQIAQQLRARESTIAELRQQNQRLAADLAAMSIHLKAEAERRRQQDEHPPGAKQALQQAKDEVGAMKQQREMLTIDLARAQQAAQTAQDGLSRLQSQHSALRTEYSKAMRVLDSWGGRMAKWWAVRNARELPAQLDDV